MPQLSQEKWHVHLIYLCFHLMLEHDALVYICRKRKGNILFNDALNTFYLRLYGVRHMVKDHSGSERGNPLPPHGLLFSIDSKGFCKKKTNTCCDSMNLVLPCLLARVCSIALCHSIAEHVLDRCNLMIKSLPDEVLQCQVVHYRNKLTVLTCFISSLIDSSVNLLGLTWSTDFLFLLKTVEGLLIVVRHDLCQDDDLCVLKVCSKLDPSYDLDFVYYYYLFIFIIIIIFFFFFF